MKDLQNFISESRTIYPTEIKLNLDEIEEIYNRFKKRKLAPGEKISIYVIDNWERRYVGAAAEDDRKSEVICDVKFE